MIPGRTRIICREPRLTGNLIDTGGRYFAYGMEFSINGIKEEWLYEINSRSDKLIFTRKYNEDGNEFEFGDIHGDSSVAQFVKFLGKALPLKEFPFGIHRAQRKRNVRD